MVHLEVHVAARRLADGLRDMAVAGVELEGLLRVRFRVRARVGVRVRVRVRARVRATVRATVRVRDRDRVARPVSSWKACFSSSSYPSVWRQCCPLPWRMTWLRVRVRVRARVRVRVRVRVGVGVRVRARATVRVGVRVRARVRPTPGGSHFRRRATRTRRAPCEG